MRKTPAFLFTFSLLLSSPFLTHTPSLPQPTHHNITCKRSCVTFIVHHNPIGRHLIVHRACYICAATKVGPTPPPAAALACRAGQRFNAALERAAHDTEAERGSHFCSVVLSESSPPLPWRGRRHASSGARA